MQIKKRLALFLAIYIIICFIISLVSIFYDLSISDYKKKINIEFDKDIVIHQNEEITNYALIKDVTNCTILTQEEKIDTSEIGKKRISIVAKDRYKNKIQFFYYVDIIE